MCSQDQEFLPSELVLSMGGLLMCSQDQEFLPSELVLHNISEKLCLDLRTTICFESFVVIKQGHAPCKICFE